MRGTKSFKPTEFCWQAQDVDAAPATHPLAFWQQCAVHVDNMNPGRTAPQRLCRSNERECPTLSTVSVVSACARSKRDGTQRRAPPLQASAASLLVHAFRGLLGDAFISVSGLIGSAPLASQAPGFVCVNSTAVSLAEPVKCRPQPCNGARICNAL